MKIKILFKDKDILVIDKPSGISVHPDGRTSEKTISDWFVKKYPKAKNVGEAIFFEGKEIKKPGIVHRLDKETSGVLILVKNQKAYEFLKEQFSAPALGLKTKSDLANKQKRIKKTYIAIVQGWLKNDHGVIDKPIGRSPSDFRRHLAGRGARGELRKAITEWKVLKRFKSSSNKFSLLEISPKTGRTHQIRVHLKFLSYPIVCDSLYNPNGICPKGIARLALHAKSIEFSTLSGFVSGGKDLKGKTLKIESPLPKDMLGVIKYKDEKRD